MKCRITQKEIQIFPENESQRKRLTKIWKKGDLFTEVQWYDSKLMYIKGYLKNRKGEK